MNITELIPSKDVREHIRKTGHAFTDSEKATIIYNLVLDRKEIHAHLERLAADTQDGMLKQQIYERITYDKRCWDLFENDTKGCFYEVSFLGDSWYKNGYFADLGPAERFGRNEGMRYCIKKHQIIGAKKPVIKTYARTNWRFWGDASTGGGKENKQPLRIQEYGGEPIAEAQYDADGNVTDFYTFEVPAEEVMKMEDFGAERFEEKYVKLPHPFQAGDIVRSVADPGNRGVVEMPASDYDAFAKRVHEEDLIVDWTDSSIQVLFLDEYDRVLSHDHIIPLYLEYADTEDMDKRRDPLMAAASVMRGELLLGTFLDIYRADYPGR